MKSLLLALSLASVASAADFYVSPTGNDANPGSKSKPFQTLEKARDTIRGKGGTVFLLGGEYVLTNTFVLKPEDSGVRYEAAPGAKPVLSGAREITGWQKLAAGATNIPAAADGKLFVAAVPTNWFFKTFYVNGKSQQVARWPDHDEWRKWTPYRGYDHAGVWFPTNAPLAGLDGCNDVEMIVFPAEFWNTIINLRGINSTKRLTGFASKNTVQIGKFRPGWMPHQFSLRNAISALDQPGEWCVDTAAGKLYYWPPDGTMAGKKTFAPAIYNLVRLEADAESGPVVEKVAFHGLTFRYTDRLEEAKWPAEWQKRQSEISDAAIVMQGVANIDFTGNTIEDVGNGGLALAYRATKVNIIGNEIGRTGSFGVNLYSFGVGKLNGNRENVIRRNYIHDVGLAPYWHASAITLYASSHNVITHNFLQNLPYGGISIVETMAKDLPDDRSKQANLKPRDGANAYKQFRYAEIPADFKFTEESIEQWLHSGDNRVERNICRDYMTHLDDGSALYSWATGTNNVWRENIVIRTTKGGKANGIYMDDETDEALVEGNLCWGPVAQAWFDNSHSLRGKPIAEVCTNTDPLPKASGKSTNTYRNNHASAKEKPPGYDALVEKILKDVKKGGGWPGNPSLPTALE